MPAYYQMGIKKTGTWGVFELGRLEYFPLCMYWPNHFHNFMTVHLWIFPLHFHKGVAAK